MGELRKDYILDRYVIIATERAKRPDQFSRPRDERKVDTCYFCPGNEHTTPKEIARYPKGRSLWRMRVFPNKFSAVTPFGAPNVTTDNTYYTYASNFGHHEVIVETPDHDKELSDLSQEDFEMLLRIYADRIEYLSRQPGIRYVSVFKNCGSDAGTSLIHSHSQVIATNIVPQSIRDEEEGCRRLGDDTYGKIIEIEKGSDRRIGECATAVSFAPYASRFPMEAWIFPKRDVKSITEFTAQEFAGFAGLMRGIILKLRTINAPYNLCLHYGLESMRFHMEIMPRLSKWAGFELSTGIIINSVPPEDAARFYRE